LARLGLFQFGFENGAGIRVSRTLLVGVDSLARRCRGLRAVATLTAWVLTRVP
jgi:hypothetical protein